MTDETNVQPPVEAPTQSQEAPETDTGDSRYTAFDTRLTALEARVLNSAGNEDAPEPAKEAAEATEATGLAPVNEAPPEREHYERTPTRKHTLFARPFSRRR